MQQTLAVRVLTLLLLVAATGIVAVAWLGGRGRSADTAATTNVKAAAAAVEAWYQDPYGGRGSYRRLSAAALVRQAPAVSSRVHVTVLAQGAAYCLDDEEGRGHSAYFVGGNVSRVTNLGGAVSNAVTLVHSTLPDAAAICANAS